jgi:hypothetical protein
MCGKAECRVLHRQKTQAQQRRRNRGYAIAYRIDQRATQTESQFAKDEFAQVYMQVGNLNDATRV